MNSIYAFLIENSDKLWTIVATLIGAFISYMATTASEKRKEMHQSQREILKNVLIPLCSSVEDAMDAIDQYKTIHLNDFDIKLQTPSDYLKAEKRVYLSGKQRKQLEDYDAAVRSFYVTWREEQSVVLTNYKHWLAQQMVNCLDAPHAVDVSISLGIRETDLRIPILEKKTETYKESVTSITYVVNNKADKFQDVSFTFDENVKRLCAQIEYGIRTINDVTDQKTQIACKLYSYLIGIDDKPEIERIIAGTKTNGNLLSLGEAAKNLRRVLVKNIDRIAR